MSNNFHRLILVYLTKTGGIDVLTTCHLYYAGQMDVLSAIGWQALVLNGLSSLKYDNNNNKLIIIIVTPLPEFQFNDAVCVNILKNVGHKLQPLTKTYVY